jgi:3-oxoacyl-[acyl-carrier-protein] synthase II
MKIYINGSSSISAHPITGLSTDLSAPAVFSGDRLYCIEPDYDKIFESNQIRRLNRILKMGLATSYEAIKRAGNPQPDAIIAGTGFGYLEDTARFLFKMTNPGDRSMNPTSFIHSTHNAISSLIAINLKNNGYNNTFVHSGFSFESALDDAIMLLKAGDAKNVLVGGIDELANEVYALLKRIQVARIKTTRRELSVQPGKSYCFGEGSSFFVLSDKPNSEYSVEIVDFKILYKPGIDQIMSVYSNLTNNVNFDLFLLGKNNEKNNDETYGWISNLTDINRCFNYKSLCGDYPTALSFGLGLAASLLSGNNGKDGPSGNVDNILLYNCFESNYHAFISLRRIQP